MTLPELIGEPMRRSWKQEWEALFAEHCVITGVKPPAQAHMATVESCRQAFSNSLNKRLAEGWWAATSSDEWSPRSRPLVRFSTLLQGVVQHTTTQHSMAARELFWHEARAAARLVASSARRAFLCLRCRLRVFPTFRLQHHAKASP